MSISPRFRSRKPAQVAALLAAAASFGACGRDAPAPGADATASVEGAALRQFVLTRALGIENPVVLDPILTTMSVGDGATGASDASARALLWQSYFRGALLTAARSRSREPLALHYNPVSDVGLIQRCAPADDDTVRCRDFCAFPGEILSGATRPGFEPGWLAAAAPLSAMVDTARARIEAFGSRHPLESTAAADWKGAFCRPEWQVIAESRQLQALRTIAETDRTALEGALGLYRGEAGRRNADERITYLLDHASQFSLVGAATLGSQHRLLIFAPRRSAWHMIAVLMGPSTQSAGRSAALLEATVLSFPLGGRRMPNSRLLRASRIVLCACLLASLLPATAAAQFQATSTILRFLDNPRAAIREKMDELRQDLQQRAARAFGQDEGAAEAISKAAEHKYAIGRKGLSEVQDGLDRVSSSSGSGAPREGVIDWLQRDKSPEMKRDVMNRLIPDGLRRMIDESESAADLVERAVEKSKAGVAKLSEAASRLADRVGSYFSEEAAYGLEPGSRQAEAARRSLGSKASPKGGDLASLIGGEGNRNIGSLFQSNSAAMDAFAEREAARGEANALAADRLATSGSEPEAGATRAAGNASSTAARGEGADAGERAQTGNAGGEYPQRVGTSVTTRCGDGRYVTYTVTEDPKFWTTDPKTRFDPCAADAVAAVADKSAKEREEEQLALDLLEKAATATAVPQRGAVAGDNRALARKLEAFGGEQGERDGADGGLNTPECRALYGPGQRILDEGDLLLQTSRSQSTCDLYAIRTLTYNRILAMPGLAKCPYSHKLYIGEAQRNAAAKKAAGCR